MASAAPSRLALRLGALSRDELLELAADALDELPEPHRLHRRADALIAQRKPLPSWCVDKVLLSPDLLPHVVESLSLGDVAASTACKAWAGAWTALLGRRRYLNPVPRIIEVPELWPRAIAEMPDGALCITGAQRLAVSA